MEFNYTLIAIATVIQFVLGALWYSPLLFGKIWMKIMGGDACTPEERQAMQKSMTPFYVLQIVLTVITTTTLSFLLQSLDIGSYTVAFLVWFGFIAPTQIGCVIWANTPKSVWLQQILIMNTYQLLASMIATYILLM